ncbi:S49 family peptidase [Albimonas pacifica]|uniref:Serine protease SohB n=1 Tax=Albimonas pacifica TaxID=1114924 RepID=A0A1I3F460_9RHOB|nr:S49 family peptidase [Albimonas pacifica]SFI05953.1 serine protease SohB [Albimonas pacifica]
MTLRTNLSRLMRRPPRVSVVRLYGPIGMPGRMASSLSDEFIGPALESAFGTKPAAVALAVNSPGGSAVQSGLIASRIRRLADETKVPVYAFCEDAAASGGYWLACAADEIWVDGASIIGSIGVISAGFGFHQAIAKVGVERRVHTAGARKAILDPFQPEREEDVATLREMQDQIHTLFQTHVRERRGARLADIDLFTGEFWTGARATELGLADGIGHLPSVMRDKLGEKVKFKEYGPRRALGQRLGLVNGPNGVAADAAAAAAAQLETQAMWARLGI